MDDLCFICQEVKKISLVENPSQESLENLITRTRQQHHFKDLSVQVHYRVLEETQIGHLD